MHHSEKEDHILELLLENIKKSDRNHENIQEILRSLDKNDFRVSVIQDVLLLQIEEIKALKTSSILLETEMQNLRKDLQKQK